VSFYAKNCSGCDAPIYVTFTKLDGSESVQTRIVRGAVSIQFHQKQSTHSGHHTSIQKTWCASCAANGLVELWVEMRSRLLDPAGIDPDRRIPNAKGRRRMHPNGDVSFTTGLVAR
jgi:hypothetical protein